MGEVVLQLGGPDAQQQLESHNSQPQIKYARLKNLIINSLVMRDDDRQSVYDDFEKIFLGLLRGRRIKNIGVNELGLMSVMTEEIGSGRLIELDSLSSGEKNIALTFLIVSRSISTGGIVLFDEPELHLNPAVSRDLLPFIVREYSEKNSIQFLMCTHSPEILTGAFSSDACSLLHLKSAREITRVGRRALDEYSDALHRLGTSVSETLLFEGTILVEGDDDVVFLENAFPDILKRFNVKDRGGRREIEKTAAELQSLELQGQRVSPVVLIFDRDDEITGLKSTGTVRILQWPMRCIDNFLIDFDVLTELLKDSSLTKQPLASEGEVNRILRELAYSQLDEIAAREVYKSYNYQNASARKTDFSGNLSEITTSLHSRLLAAKTSVSNFDVDNWSEFFRRTAEHKKGLMLVEWEAKWTELCDGKKLISDLHKSRQMTISEANFRLYIIKKMRDTSSKNWKVVKDLLEGALRQP